ncbi:MULTISPECIES: AzlC family ABC transporter permease [unclassified Streptomyces]|uniref:AzlC family ABC transporter permease n=1 Tax=unclassified Streptomyces TaxID=2593676 RepID=UPI0035D7576B
MAFGALAVQSGLDRWWAGLSAALIYGGSFEFLLTGMVAAVAPLASVTAAAFLVNARHVVYTLSFPLHRMRGHSALSRPASSSPTRCSWPPSPSSPQYFSSATAPPGRP